jgi:hypothetical protein
MRSPKVTAPGLVEQQRIDVAGGFHRAAGGGDDVEAHVKVTSGDGRPAGALRVAAQKRSGRTRVTIR